jgi:hypothetical protein
MTVSVRDRDIITKSFRLLTRGVQPSDLLQQMDWDRYFNVFSSATGDNRYVNPIPQSSPATDPRYSRFLNSSDGGMGSMYKEVYENNVTLLTLTPSVPQFAGLLSFITNMFSPSAAIIANKGRAPGLAFYMGQAATAIAFWPMQLISIGIQFLSFLTDSPKNNFWTCKPAMGAYTMAATGILNDLMVKLGYIDPVLPKRNQEQTDSLYGRKPDYDNSKAVADMSLLMPDVINSDGTIDLMRLIMKGTRKHRVMLNKLAKMDNEALTTPEEKFTRAQQLMEEVTFDDTVWAGDPTQQFIEKEFGSVGKYRGDDEGKFVEQDSAYANETAYANVNNGFKEQGDSLSAGGTGQLGTDGNPGAQMENSSAGAPGPALSPNPNQPSTRPQPASSQTGGNAAIASGQTISYEDNPNDRTWAGDVADLVQTAFSGGLDAITFRVDGGVGPVTDSFSNSHSPSPMAEKFNSVVKASNDFRFDVAGGATGIGIIDSVVNTLKEGAIGALSGTVIGNIPLALVNNSYVKIADHWDGSTTNLHKESYSISSHCNYAHPYEQIMKIWVLLALFLPMVAPNTAGGSTYTSPFMLKAFCKSRSIIRTGMMESLSFTIGSGDGGWTIDRRPLNIKIDFTIVDLEPLITVPVDRSISLLDATNPSQIANRLFNDDTAYNNYLSRLTGIDYLDTVMKYARLNRNLTGITLDMKQSIRADNIAAKVSDSIVGDLARIFSRPISR